MRKLIAALLVLSTMFSGLSAPSFAEMGAEEMLFSTLPTVISGSRREQPLNEAPVTIEVVTREEIEESKALNLWDLLRFHAGMEVVDARNTDTRTIVSVRGFLAEYVYQLQVMVDGLSVYQVDSGGVHWAQLPVQIQDIERIEIVKGPNAAIYGSNAAVGVVNIITKKPSRGTSFSIAALQGNQGTARFSESFEGRAGEKFSYRLSHTYKTTNGSVSREGGKLTDYDQNEIANFRGVLEVSPRTSLDVSAGGTWNQLSANPYVKTRRDIDSHFEMAKFSTAFEGGSVLEVLGGHTDFGVKNFSRYYQYDLEVVHRFAWLNDRLYTTWGGSYRDAVVNSAANFGSQPRNRSDIARGFAQQSWKALEKVTAVGSFSLERSGTGDTQPAYQGAVIGAFSPDHTLRLTASRAPTLPPLIFEKGKPTVGPITLTPNNMEPQQLNNYEAGYQGHFLNRGLVAEVNAFYTIVHGIESLSVTGFPPVFKFVNFNSAIARGAEAKLNYRLRNGGRLYLNYTRERISDAKGNRDVTEDTPENMVNVGGAIALTGKATLSVDAGYKGGHLLTNYLAGAPVSLRVHAYTRVDARLSYRPIDALEVFMACENLTRARHLESPLPPAPGVNVWVPRVYYGGMIFRMGANGR